MSRPSTSLVTVRAPITSKEGTATRDMIKWMQDMDKKVNASLTQLGLDPGAVVGGNSGTLGTQLQHLDANGQLQPGGIGFTIPEVPGTVTPPQVGFTLDSVPDGTTRFSVAQVDAANLAIINFADAAHQNKNLDNIDDGTTYQRFTRVATGQVALPTGLIGIGTSSTATAAAPGVLVTDSVEWALSGGPASGYASLTVIAYVTAGAVNFNVSNPSVVLGVTPGAQTVNYVVIR